MLKIVFLHHCYLALGSRSKFGVKVKGRGQCHWSKSRSTFLRAAVNNRGSALPSEAKNNRSHYQSKVFVCVCNQWAYTDNRTDAVNQLLLYFRLLG